MPNKKISQLNYNTHPTTADLLPIVNSGETKQISLSGLSSIINSSITVTKSELDSLISSSGLTQSAFYKVTGVNVDLYGGTDVVIQALSTHQISRSGHGLFYNPNYDYFGIWNPISTLTLTSQSLFFTVNELIFGDSGQIAEMIGLPGEESMSIITIQGSFSGGTVITGGTSNATATVTNNNVANYNVGDKVIWGGRVWESVSGTNTSVVNKVVYTGTSDYNQSFNIGGVQINTVSFTNGVETFSYNGNFLNSPNLSGDSGGQGYVDTNGNVTIQFNAGAVDGVHISGSYVTNIFSYVNTWILGSAWKLVPYNETDYVSTWDIIEYEYDHDNISFRKDYENQISSEYAVTVNYWGYNSIKAMQWGGKVHQFSGKNPYLLNLVNFNGNSVQRLNIEELGGFDFYGVCGQNVYINDINIGSDAYMNFVNIGDNNAVSNIDIGSYSYFDNIVIANNDYGSVQFNNITLGPSGNGSRVFINNFNLGSGSYFYGVNLKGSNESGAYIEDINLYDNSGFFSISLDQGSHIYTINSYTGIIRDIQLGQGAYIQYVDIYSGGMFDLKLDGGSGYNNLSRASYISNFTIGYNSNLNNIVLGLGSYLSQINMNQSDCSFKFITLGHNSRMYNIEYSGSHGSIYYNKLGDNALLHDIVLGQNCSLNTNTFGDNSFSRYLTLNNQSLIDTNEIGNASYFEYITVGTNSELGFFKIGLDASVGQLELKENIYVGDITVGEYLFLYGNGGPIVFTDTVQGKIIDRNNNNFPATFYVDETNEIDLSYIQYAGVVTLKTQNASLTYTNYAGTGFTINDIIQDTTTDASAVIVDNSVTYAVVIGEIIGTGNGSQPIFSFALSNAIEVPSSIVITDTVETFYDNGYGVLNGSYGGSGFINYGNGTGQVTFNNAPSYNQAITANYEHATGGTLTLSVRSPKTYGFNHGNTITNNVNATAIVNTYTAPATAATISSITQMLVDYTNNDLDCGAYPVKFLPEYGLTVTFSGTPISSISNNQIAMPAQNFVANGSFDDYIVIGVKNNTSVNDKFYVQQIDAQNYN